MCISPVTFKVIWPPHHRGFIIWWSLQSLFLRYWHKNLRIFLLCLSLVLHQLYLIIPRNHFPAISYLCKNSPSYNHCKSPPNPFSVDVAMFCESFQFSSFPSCWKITQPKTVLTVNDSFWFPKQWSNTQCVWVCRV